MQQFDMRVFMDGVRALAGESTARMTFAQALKACMGKDGEEFVKQAYPLILDRCADPIGLADYARVGASKRKKIIALLSLALCSESLARYGAGRLLLRLRGRKF